MSLGSSKCCGSWETPYQWRIPLEEFIEDLEIEGVLPKKEATSEKCECFCEICRTAFQTDGYHICPDCRAAIAGWKLVLAMPEGWKLVCGGRKWFVDSCERDVFEGEGATPLAALKAATKEGK